MAEKKTRNRPYKLYQYEDPKLDHEIRNIYEALNKVDLGKFHFYYEDGTLYLRYRVLDRDNSNADEWVTKDSWSI